MVVRSKNTSRTVRIDHLFDYTTRYSLTVAGRSTPPQLIKSHEGPRGNAPQHSASFSHFNEEGGLILKEVVSSAHTDVHAVDGGHSERPGRDHTTQLRIYIILYIHTCIILFVSFIFRVYYLIFILIGRIS